MSPEQAKGKVVDKRADIWAFGVVVFEMLTGGRAFKGDDISDTLASVLRQDVDWKALPADTPPRLKRLLERCLDRDVKTRLRDIGEARVELARLESGAAEAVEPAPALAAAPVAAAPARRRALPWIAGIAAGIALASAAAWAIVHFAPEPKAQPVRFAFVPPAAQAISTSAVDRVLAISPDGTHIAYITASDALAVRAIDRLDAELLPGIAGARVPFFSWDGKWIGFFQSATEMRKVSITGGPSIPVCKVNAAPRGASWGPDDTIVFATADTSSGLFTVAAGGGEPKMITKPDSAHGEGDHLHPSVLPGGQAVLFTITAPGGQVESNQVAVLDLKTGKQKTLIRGGSQAEYVEAFDAAQAKPSGGGQGYLVYAAAGTLRAVRFDLSRLEVRSDPVPVAEQVAAVSTGAAEYSISRAGALVYVPGGLNSQGVLRSLAWVDRKGHEEPIKAPPRAFTALRLSPDGTRLALDIRDQDNDIWVWDLARGTPTRLTFDPGLDYYPVWTPDSRRIVFSSVQGGAANLFWQAADGTGTLERLMTADHQQNASSFSPDGASLLVRDVNGPTGDDIAILSMSGKRQLAPLIQTSFAERNAEVSPDGHWVAYESAESTPTQVYVKPFPSVNSGRWQISTSGGVKPVWAPNGRELFYLNNNALYVVAIQTTPAFSPGNPVKLFDMRPIAGVVGARYYDVSRDGQRFVVIKEPQPTDSSAAASQSLVVVVHWIEELKAKVGIK
jgi:serine/threonine-protein kinase